MYAQGDSKVITNAVNDAAESEALLGCIDHASNCGLGMQKHRAAQDDVVCDLAKLGTYAYGLVRLAKHCPRYLATKAILCVELKPVSWDNS
jgi:hypothetical protein